MTRVTGKPQSKLRAASNIKDQDPPAPAEEAPQQPQSGRARPPVNRDRCPSGWDEGVWHLALLFRQGARACGIELRAGLPIIYAEIHHLVTHWRMRDQTYIQVTTGCERRLLSESLAEHCWLHTRSLSDGQITWVEMVEVIMAEFWSRIWDEYALDYFRQYFAPYGQQAVVHWQSLDIINAINARPKQPRGPMRRRTPGGTMPVVSKEGE